MVDTQLDLPLSDDLWIIDYECDLHEWVFENYSDEYFAAQREALENPDHEQVRNWNGFYPSTPLPVEDQPRVTLLMNGIYGQILSLSFYSGYVTDRWIDNGSVGRHDWHIFWEEDCGDEPIVKEESFSSYQDARYALEVRDAEFSHWHTPVPPHCVLSYDNDRKYQRPESFEIPRYRTYSQGGWDDNSLRNCLWTVRYSLGTILRMIKWPFQEDEHGCSPFGNWWITNFDPSWSEFREFHNSRRYYGDIPPFWYFAGRYRAHESVSFDELLRHDFRNYPVGHSPW